MQHARVAPRAAPVTVRNPAVVLCVVVGLAAAQARAAITLGEDEVIVSAHEVIQDDLVAWGRYIRIDGIVKGDLVAIGQEVVVEGIVEGDLFAAGKTVYLNGTFSDDARVVAYAVALGEAARVADDFFGLSYSLEAKPGSRVGGSLHAASRQALLAGQVTEFVRVRAGALALHGLTGADVEVVVGGLEGVTHSSLVIDLAIEIPDVEEGLSIAGSAHIGGDLEYRAMQAAKIEPGASIGGRTLHAPWRTGLSQPLTAPQSDDEPGDLGRGSDSGEALRRLGGLVALGLLLLLGAPRWTLRRGGEIRAAPVRALGWGFGAVVFIATASLAIAIVCAILLVAFAGMGAGLALEIAAVALMLQAALLAPFLLGLIYLGPVLTSLGAGHFVLEKLGSQHLETRDDPRRGAAAVCVGALVYASLRSVPGLGPLVGFFGALMGLGAVARWLREERRTAF